MSAFDVPPNLADAALAEGRTSWFDDLPAKIRLLSQRWQLVAVGAPFRPGGRTAWVAPVQTRSRSDMVLKIAWRHPEAEGEADGLRAFDGQGAVRLVAAETLDAHTNALLIERCRPGTALSTRPEDEQDTVITALLQCLWATMESPRDFASLQAMCDAWADQFDARPASTRRAIDPGLAREATALFRSLPTTAGRSVLLCTDLHAGNVLAAEREPWPVIDPKPHVGDPTYDVVQHILNCDERLRRDPRGLVDRIAGVAGLDPDRLRLWLFARCVIEAPDWPQLAQVARQLAP
jgi:streptomycin 6-kinase